LGVGLSLHLFEGPDLSITSRYHESYEGFVIAILDQLEMLVSLLWTLTRLLQLNATTFPKNIHPFLYSLYPIQGSGALKNNDVISKKVSSLCFLLRSIIMEVSLWVSLT